MTTWQEKFKEISRPSGNDGNGRRYNQDGLDESQWETVFAVHQRLIEDMDPNTIEKLPPGEAREVVEKAARAIMRDVAAGVAGVERDILISHVADEVLGLGPIEVMIADPSISEVMVNAPDNIFYERDGVLYLSNARFRDDRHIMRIAERILSPLGRRVDESSPYVDARLEDGSRVNIIIPPVAPRSPTITIRKFRTDKYTMGDLMSGGTVTPELAEFFNACIKGRLNTIVSGGTGTGKTTLLNALSAYLPATERIVTIEDPTELRLQQPHVVSLEARPPNLEGKNEVTQRDLVRNALRMRPDRIIIGEVRGPEAFDMMQAMNTGHEGSLTTVHANSPRDALMRVENMILMAGFDLPVRVIREQMSSALHIVFQLARFVDGSRKVVAVSELSGLEGQIITLQELFRFHHEGVDANGHVLGSITPTGIQPRFLDRLAEMGVQIPSDLFSPVRG
ncbi:MAG: CpaF family protein [Chloroflexi bacterium]|nr:CpaF family protein [Chloroflexota bacterium]